MRAAALAGICGIALLMPASASARVELRPAYAEELMEEALSRRPVLKFPGDQTRPVVCSRRRSRFRMRCSTHWFSGRYTFYGPGEIWITFRNGTAFWNYSYRITRYNERCTESFAIPCERVFVVR